MSTQNRASRCSLRNQTVGIKAWVRATEYHPIQQTPVKGCIVPFSGSAFRNSSLRLDEEGSASRRSSSSQKNNPRTTTKKRRNGRPLRRRHGWEPRSIFLLQSDRWRSATIPLPPFPRRVPPHHSVSRHDLGEVAEHHRCDDRNRTVRFYLDHAHHSIFFTNFQKLPLPAQVTV